MLAVYMLTSEIHSQKSLWKEVNNINEHYINIYISYSNDKAYDLDYRWLSPSRQSTQASIHMQGIMPFSEHSWKLGFIVLQYTNTDCTIALTSSVPHYFCEYLQLFILSTSSSHKKENPFLKCALYAPSLHMLKPSKMNHLA